MPVTVRGTDILFNDGTTQTTAAGAVTTTAVLNATAGLTAGAVGSYAFLADLTNSGTNINEGSTVAGSNLRFSSVYFQDSVFEFAFDSGVNAPSGTWRLLGRGRRDIGSGTSRYASLFVRIS